MENMTSKSYRKINRHPEQMRDLGTVESALHSISIVEQILWRDAFRKLIHSSALSGTMPHTRKSIYTMFSECGFFLQAGSYAKRSVSSIIRECDERFHDGEQVIINLMDSPNHGRYMPIVPIKVNGISHYELLYPVDYRENIAYEVWIRWRDRQDHSIAPRRKAGRIAEKKTMSAQDHESLVAFNENPTDNIVGDCAVRALAGVLEISWEEAAWKLAAAGDFVCSCINLVTNIEKCLEKEGFEKHGPIKRDGRILTGKEFCDLIQDMFQAGTRLYAYSGHHHAVAILVFDGHYKIVDTWDSTGKPITGYWAKYPERPRRSKQIHDSEKLTKLEVGMKVVHKIYGIGKVSDIAGAIATICFADNTEKKLAVAWIIANCKPG